MYRKESVMTPKEILEGLTGLRENQYDQEQELTLVFALVEAHNPNLLWRALEIAHMNGMREAAEIMSDRAEALSRNVITKGVLLKSLFE